MISKNARKLLTQLIKAQQQPDNCCFIDEENNQAFTFAVPKDKAVTVPIPAGSTSSLLEELENNGCAKVQNDVYTVCQITSKGWHYKELTFKTLGIEFVRSILCPLAVSVITALLTTLAIELLK